MKDKKKIITISAIVIIVIAIGVVLYFLFKKDKKEDIRVSNVSGDIFGGGIPFIPNYEWSNGSVGNNTKTYVVQEGDTLSGIAVKFDTTVDKLAKKNGISNPDLIIVGQTLYV